MWPKLIGESDPHNRSRRMKTLAAHALVGAASRSQVKAEVALRAEAVASASSAVEDAERENKATLAKAKQMEGEVGTRRRCMFAGESETDICLDASWLTEDGWTNGQIPLNG